MKNTKELIIRIRSLINHIKWLNKKGFDSERECVRKSIDLEVKRFLEELQDFEKKDLIEGLQLQEVLAKVIKERDLYREALEGAKKSLGYLAKHNMLEEKFNEVSQNGYSHAQQALKAGDKVKESELK